jgi:hypothetical protein
MLEFKELPEVNSERWLSLEDFEEEVWKDVLGFEGILSISNYGRVKRVLKGKIGKLAKNRDNYYVYGYKSKTYLIHRMVAMAFIPNPNNKPCVDHINTHRSDSRVCNLRWVTHRENANNILTRQHLKESHINTLFSDKRVAKLDREGNLIQIYNCVTDAAKDNGLAKCSISNAAHGRMMPNKYGQYFQCKTAGGYKWRFV